MPAVDPCVYLAVPHYGAITWPTCASLLTASFRSHPLVVGEQGSLLSFVFNRLWAECLNMRVQPDIPRRPTHFAMIHADCSPDPGWLDVLVDEMARVDADVISVVSPIKDGRGLTSTGILQDQASGRVRRLTMHEVFTLPETFDAAGAGAAGKGLAVNTGCWLCRLDRPWVADFPGFTILDQIQKVGEQRLPAVLSEDWNASRWWADHGVRVFATRKVLLGHLGTASFRNDKAWGDWKFDHGDGALCGPGEIEGWMTGEELSWLKSRASTRRRVVEIGCWKGRSTKALAETCPGVVITVDHFKGSPMDDAFSLADAAANGAGDEARQAFRRNLLCELDAGKVDLWEVDSLEAAARVGANGFRPQMVFIDGAHDTASVKADILAWLPLVQSSGLLCGHDANDARVRAALDEVLPGWRPAAGSIWEYEVA